MNNASGHRQRPGTHTEGNWPGSQDHPTPTACWRSNQQSPDQHPLVRAHTVTSQHPPRAS